MRQEEIMCECCGVSNQSGGHEIIAVTGKGGVGKTTIVALITRLLSAKGFSVLAVDADPAVSLSYALGGKPDRTIADLRKRMIEDPDEKRRIQDIPMDEVVLREAVISLNGFSLLTMGKSEGPGCFCKINDLLRYGISTLSGKYDFTIVDCEAGVEQINRSVLESITRLIMISDTSAKGLRTITSIHEIAHEYGIQGSYKKGVILNRIRGTEVKVLEEKIGHAGFDFLGAIPEDQTVTEYDLLDKPITGVPDGSPCVKAVQGILMKQGFLN
jgi:CO dehydrogenase maturation factor